MPIFYILSILPLTGSLPLSAIFVFCEDTASVLRKQCAVLQSTLALRDLKNLLGERTKEISQVVMLQCLSISNFSFISLLSLMSIRACLLSRNNPEMAKLFNGSQYRLTFSHQLCRMENFTQQAKPSSNENRRLCRFQIYNRLINFSRKVAVRKGSVTHTKSKSGLNASGLQLSTPLKVVNIYRVKVWLSLERY